MNSSRVWQTIAETLRRRPDLGISRAMRIFDPVVRIAATNPLAGGPGVESMPVGTPQNRSDNNIYVSTLQGYAP